MESLKKQCGGNHYRDMKIQVVEFCHLNNIGFLAGNVIKYVCRYKQKGGVADLEKAKHYCEILIDFETGQNLPLREKKQPLGYTGSISPEETL